MVHKDWKGDAVLWYRLQFMLLVMQQMIMFFQHLRQWCQRMGHEIGASGYL